MSTLSPPLDSLVVSADRTVSVETLPSYAKTLLRIKVPVIVTLAAKKQALGHIVEIGPGSIIQFDKSCEEMLEMHVNDQIVARDQLTLSLTFDHRVVDGAPAARFLKDLRQGIEQPGAWLVP